MRTLYKVITIIDNDDLSFLRKFNRVIVETKSFVITKPQIRYLRGEYGYMAREFLLSIITIILIVFRAITIVRYILPGYYLLRNKK